MTNALGNGKEACIVNPVMKDATSNITIAVIMVPFDCSEVE